MAFSAFDSVMTPTAAASNATHSNLLSASTRSARGSTGRIMMSSVSARLTIGQQDQHNDARLHECAAGATNSLL